MNKKLLATTICAISIALTSAAFAGEAVKGPKGDCPKPVKCECGCDCGCHKHHEMYARKHHHQGPPPEVIKKFKEEMAQALNLTADQRCKIDKKHEKTMKKLERIRKQEKRLAEKKINAIKEEKEYFMSILTEEQKCELKKFKEAKKAEFEAKKDAKKGCPIKKPCTKPIKK